MLKSENEFGIGESGIPCVWNQKNYQEFVRYLWSIRDEKYKEFHSSLVLNSKYEMIGIRLPIMRKIAKEIAKTDIEKFLKYAEDKFYEEVMIQGLTISLLKDEDVFYSYFKAYVPKIDNWALCDTFCNSIKIVRKYEEKYFREAVEMALNTEEFISRTGLVIILSHFIHSQNITIIFDMLNKMKSDLFYVNMAEAWLVCEMYTKYPKETTRFLQQNNLNKFTHNKAISKIHDSFRVSKEEKEYLNTLRR